MAGRARRTARKALAGLRGQPIDRSQPIPGPSPDPSSNIIIADVTMRMASYVMRRAVERTFLKKRYGKQTARDILDNRSIGQTLVSVAIARLATSSLPGGVLVTTGLLAKTLLDRSKKRRRAEAEGDAELLEQARRD